MENEILENLKDENGQISFADAIYYDTKLPDEDKIYWLEECVKEGQTDQQPRIDELKKSSGVTAK